MSIHTDFNALTREQEELVLQWLTRRLGDCLELDTKADCQELARKIWKLHQDNDFHSDHSRTAEQVVTQGISYDGRQAQEARTRQMLQDIAVLLAQSQTSLQVRDEDRAAFLEQVMQATHFGYILVAVEVVTGT